MWTMTNKQCLAICLAIRELGMAVSYLAAMQVVKDDPDMKHIRKCLCAVNDDVEDAAFVDEMVELTMAADREDNP